MEVGAVLAVKRLADALQDIEGVVTNLANQLKPGPKLPSLQIASLPDLENRA